MEIQEFVPYLSVTDAQKAVDFYTNVFGMQPHLLLNMPDNKVMHSEFRIGSTRFFISEELPEHGGTPSPKTLGSTTVAIHIYANDCDALVKKMNEYGAETIMEPVDMFWGERFARVRDPFGHEWGVATKTKDMSANEIKDAADAIFKAMQD